MFLRYKFNVSVILIILIMFTFYLPTVSEDTITEKTESSPLEKMLFECEEANTEEIQRILGSDVFFYFELEEEYNTPLKKKVFSKTEEYTVKEKELNNLKSEIKNKVYYRSMSLGDGAQYDTDRSGFIIPNNYVQMTSAVTDSEYKYNFIGLPLKVYNFGQYGKIVNQNCIFFKMSEEDGLKIENNLNSIEVYIFFKAEGMSDVKIATDMVQTSQYTIEAASYGINSLIKCRVLQVILADSQSGEIYFNYKK